MTGAAFLLSLALPCLLGAALLALKEFTLPVRVAIGAAFGFVLLTVEMTLFSAFGVSWSPILLLLPFFAALVLWRPRLRNSQPLRVPRAALPALCIAAAALALTTYAAYSARMTSLDLVFFWGTKGEHFGLAKGLDIEFLRVAPHQRMRPDFPPLLTCLYAWGTLCVGRLSWRAVLLLAPGFLASGAVLVWDGARKRLGASEAAEFTALYASLLGYGLFAAVTAGNAEPPLLFFETLALSAIVFEPGARLTPKLVGLGLAGAVLTKVEGTLFAVAMVGVALWRCRALRRWQSAAWILLPPLASGTLWALFCVSEGTSEFYHPGSASTFALKAFPEVLQGLIHYASYEAAYLPWVLLAIVWLARRQKTDASVPLCIGATHLAGLMFIYMTSQDRPIEWIEVSGARTLLTPLLCAFFAAAAPPRPPTATAQTRSDGNDQ